MNKAYNRINWENYPSDATPLNEANLNKLDSATNTIDDRVIALDTTKATKTEVATLVADVTFEESTGIITITKKNGSRVTIDTRMEKIAVNFTYNPTTQQIMLTLIDGTKQYIDLSALITQYEFLDTDTVAFFIGTDGKVSAIVKEGSIEEKHLEPNYLAKIKVEVAKAETSQQAASKSETNAKVSENAAKASETAAKTSETNAKSSETASKKSETNAKASETAAATSKTSAATSATNAKTSETNAKASETNAAMSASKAAQKATEIIGKAEAAAESATKAESYAVGGTGSRDGEDSDNAKYYYQQAKDVSEGLKGGLQPHGTVAFADLPALPDVNAGWMFNISDEFTTTADFKEGSGNVVPAGANVYKTSDGKWDVLAGTPVTGVKGAAETTYRRGNVNLTAKDIGLGNVDNTADADKVVKESTKLDVYELGDFANRTVADLKASLNDWVSNNIHKGSMCYFKGSDDWITYWNAQNTTDKIGAGVSWTVRLIATFNNDSYCKLLISTYNAPDYLTYKTNGTWHAVSRFVKNTDDVSDTKVYFTSSDTTDSGANAWTSVSKLTSGEKHASLFAKVSQMFKNVRYLYKMLGTTDISAIGGGTVTGALSQLNTNLADLIIQSVIINRNGNYGYIRNCIGSVCYKNKTAFFHIEGEISGTVDLYFTDFGLSQTLKTHSSIYGDVTIGQYKLLATTEDENKNILYIRAFSNNASVQLSATAVGNYGATFAVVFA